MVFYTDGAQKDEISAASMIFYYNSEKIIKKWNLGNSLDIADAELYAIEKSIEVSAKNLENRTSKNIWIFTDSQKSIQKLQNFENRTHLVEKIHQNAKYLHNFGHEIHVQWIPGHGKIPGNDLADEHAKLGLNLTRTSDYFSSIRCLEKKIELDKFDLWTNIWGQNAKKGKWYEKHQMTPKLSKFHQFGKIDKLIFSTFMQMKMGHGFFKSYLFRLPAYETNKCNGACREIQTPEHLLINCRHYFNERQLLIKNMKIPVTLRTLFNTTEGIKNTMEFLKNTKICTRKWNLGTLDDEIEYGGGWGDLEN